MNISICTLFPALYEPFLQTSLIGRAAEQGIISPHVESFFSYCAPKERIDAPTFGHGVGMVLKPAVVEQAIQKQEQLYGKALKIFFSPQGKKLTQPMLEDLAKRALAAKHLMLVAARYEGMDERVEQVYADELVSVGDFVLMGGDLPAMVLLEGLLRYVPGVVGKSASVEHDSFSGVFVDYPHYTEPLIWHDLAVPEILRSGNHGAIDAWRQQRAVERTVIHHFGWLRQQILAPKEVALIKQAMPAHYVALMHTDIALDDRVGTTSVTSIDVHDIARSSATYGFKNYFVVTPLVDQQRIVAKLLGFWQEGVGVTYNPCRHKAVNAVRVLAQLDDAVAAIEQQEGKKPLLVATSARNSDKTRSISYSDQELVWSQGRPVLLIFGTGGGLSDELLARCDYLREPIVGLSDYNHLSVRSAAAIVFDRWVGVKGIARV